MAGEIRLNTTTMATESSGSITAELDTIRPNTTNGSLTLQGDSSDAGVTGLTIDSSGVVNTTTAKVTNIQATAGQSLTIKDEDGNAAITIGTDTTAAGYLSLNFGSYHGDSGGAGSGTLTGNTLSDYETGSWTPSQKTGGATLSAASGIYTKIGNKVTVHFSITVSNTGIPGFGGLPFTNSSFYSLGVIRESANNGIMWQVNVLANTTDADIRRYDNSTTSVSGYVYIGSVTYEAS